MTASYFHLLINHLPLIGLPLITIVLAFTEFERITALRKFLLLVIFGLSTLTIPVYYSGEWSEDIVENYAGVSEASLEKHEDAAKISLIFALLTSFSAFIGLIFNQKTLSSKIVTVLFILALLSTLSFIYTAYWGGKIRRPELQQQSSTINVAPKKDQNE